MQALLSFDKAPPFAAPARFFLTAPLFLLAAALLLVFHGPELLASRWSPGLLAATHLVTVGFMLMVMCGALIQILPVVAGANLADSLGTARWLHAGLTSGAIVLAGAFLSSSIDWLAGWCRLPARCSRRWIPLGGRTSALCSAVDQSDYPRAQAGTRRPRRHGRRRLPDRHCHRA
jgi:hypothetical protein